MGRTAPRKGPKTKTTDHPHARGENPGAATTLWDLAGPSPRAWGERYPGCLVLQDVRTIPTRVGRTSWMLRVSLFPADHPHARGENTLRGGDSLDYNGPSPRAWGERAQRSPGRSYRRTIPTRVGRTLPFARAFAIASDHPHARGENRPYRRCKRYVCGPSPRAWGEHADGALTMIESRTIPTRVGRTTLSPSK